VVGYWVGWRVSGWVSGWLGVSGVERAGEGLPFEFTGDSCTYLLVDDSPSACWSWRMHTSSQPWTNLRLGCTVQPTSLTGQTSIQKHPASLAQKQRHVKVNRTSCVSQSGAQTPPPATAPPPLRAQRMGRSHFGRPAPESGSVRRMRPSWRRPQCAPSGCHQDLRGRSG